MLSLLGSKDEILRAIEAMVPTCDILVRGNEITTSGPTDDVALLDQLFAELQIIVRTGAIINIEAAERSLHMLRNESNISPSGVLTADILSNQIGRAHV